MYCDVYGRIALHLKWSYRIQLYSRIGSHTFTVTVETSAFDFPSLSSLLV